MSETRTEYDKAIEAADAIRSRFDGEIRIAVVLGSGLGAFADTLDDATVIPYEEIPHFARSTVQGHAGRLMIGKIGGVNVAVQQGRFHYYEGYAMEQVIFPMRVFGRLGVETVILTNAAGSLSTARPPGTLMLIADHINMMGVNALCGPNDERFGPRFPDMTSVYDRSLQALASQAAAEIATERRRSGLDKELNDILHRGVYCALSGPTYETPAEIRLYRLLGADAVGMSTVPEAVAARHQGIKVLGISCITNFGAGMLDQPIDHEEVIETGIKVASVFQELLRRVITRIEIVGNQ